MQLRLLVVYSEVVRVLRRLEDELDGWTVQSSRRSVTLPSGGSPIEELELRLGWPEDGTADGAKGR